jgi:hypothetical protein
MPAVHTRSSSRITSSGNVSHQDPKRRQKVDVSAQKFQCAIYLLSVGQVRLIRIAAQLANDAADFFHDLSGEA